MIESVAKKASAAKNKEDLMKRLAEKKRELLMKQYGASTTEQY
jgi:hypothetical protein